MSDLFDGKIARWRESNSVLGQELNGLADLVRACAPVPILFMRFRDAVLMISSVTVTSCDDFF